MYEYECVKLDITEEQQQLATMGLGNIDQVNTIICALINERAKDGWEPLYPFSVPAMWFRRPMTKKKPAVNKRRK